MKYIVKPPYSLILSDEEIAEIRSTILNVSKLVYNAKATHNSSVDYIKCLDEVFDFVFDVDKVFGVPPFTGINDEGEVDHKLSCLTYIDIKFKILQQAAHFYEQGFYPFKNFDRALYTVEDYFIGKRPEEYVLAMKEFEKEDDDIEIDKLLLREWFDEAKKKWFQINDVAEQLELQPEYVLDLLEDMEGFFISKDKKKAKYVE